MIFQSPKEMISHFRESFRDSGRKVTLGGPGGGGKDRKSVV